MYIPFKRKTKRKIKQFIRNYKLKRGSYPTATIVRPEQIGEKIHVFKEETDELVEMIPVYNYIKGGEFTIHIPEFSLWRYNNTIVENNCDYIIINSNYAVWPKYYHYNYSKNIPRDYNLIKESNGFITYRNDNKLIDVDCAFSLLGVYSNIWAHALVEYYPKISMLKYAISHSPRRITVLIPEYTDVQLKEIMISEIKEYDVDIRVVKQDETIRVRCLYFIERPTTFPDDAFEINISDAIIPKTVSDIIKERLVKKYTSLSTTDSKYRKIYLPRRGGMGKNLENYEEIEAFFKKMGFVFIEPHKISLDEKVNIFHSAEFIVGPHGSAFTNLFFCKPGTKALLFSNYQRTQDYYLCSAIQYFGIDVLLVTGNDNKQAYNKIHCSMSIPLHKVKAAVKELGIIG